MPLGEFWSAAPSAQRNWVVTACLCGSDTFPLDLTLQSPLMPQVPGMRLGERFLTHPPRGIGLNPQGNCQ